MTSCAPRRVRRPTLQHALLIRPRCVMHLMAAFMRPSDLAIRCGIRLCRTNLEGLHKKTSSLRAVVECLQMMNRVFSANTIPYSVRASPFLRSFPGEVCGQLIHSDELIRQRPLSNFLQQESTRLVPRKWSSPQHGHTRASGRSCPTSDFPPR